MVRVTRGFPLSELPRAIRMTGGCLCEEHSDEAIPLAGPVLGCLGSLAMMGEGFGMTAVKDSLGIPGSEGLNIAGCRFS